MAGKLQLPSAEYKASVSFILFSHSLELFNVWGRKNIARALKHRWARFDGRGVVIGYGQALATP